MAPRERMLIVDDDDDLRILLADALSDAGWIVRVASSVEHARQVVAAWEPDVVLLDYVLPDGFCEELIEELARANHPPYVLLVSGSNGAREIAEKHGVPYLGKPVSPEQILEAVNAPARTSTAA